MSLVDMLASEYGWSREYILWDLPFSTALKQADAIAIRYDDKSTTYMGIKAIPEAIRKNLIALNDLEAKGYDVVGFLKQVWNQKINGTKSKN